MTELDQTAIDEIIASAEADTTEGRLEKLEKEVETLKGSIKRLLLDIRELMNNLENPFQNLQALSEISQRAQSAQPQIQVVPAPLDVVRKEEEDKSEEENKSSAEEIEEEGAGVGDEIRVEVPKVESQVYAHEKKVEEVVPESVGVEGAVKFDVVSLYRLMSWVRDMLEKYDSKSLRLMLEIFATAGYIGDDTKNFVSMVAELVENNDGLEGIIVDLYRLRKIVEPDDVSMDSQLLTLILEKRL
ncbi:MAG: hypothetical protein ABWW66_00640 [Archaeoglobaceae archaeon]